MPVQKINLAQAFGSFDECWSPRLVGQVNDCAVKIARMAGAFIWHHHETEDEMFLVVKGTLTMHVREQPGGGGQERAIEIGEGEMIVIPHGMEHKPEAAHGDVQVLMVEPATTLNTGNIENERTVRVVKPVS